MIGGDNFPPPPQSPMSMTSRQRARLRKTSGQTALAIHRAKDDARQIERLASGSGRPVGKSVARSGKATIKANRAAQFVGSGKWTSCPFHHGRTFIRKGYADGACRTAL